MSGDPPELPSPPEAARVLAEIALLLELHSADRFRSRAFASAARALEGTDRDLGALAREGELTSLPGVGPGIASILSELVLTGRSTLHEELVAQTPLGLFDLMRIPGLGTARIRTLHEELGIDSLDALERAGREGRIAQLPGFGPKTQEKLLAGVGFARSVRGRRLYPAALEVAERLREALARRPEVVEVAVAGDLRRCMEVVDRVVLVAASREPERTLAVFGRLNGVSEVVAGEEEDSMEGVLTDGLPVRLRSVTAAQYPSALLWETGSEAHLRQLQARAEGTGLRLDRDRLRRDGRLRRAASEAALYTALGLQYLAPELREGGEEVELAAAQRVPRLVRQEDLRGTFHCHTTASDGKSTLEEMAGRAAELGWDYLGIADHSRTAAYAGGLSIEALLAQVEQIERLNRAGRTPVRLFSGTEADILADGTLDFPDDVLGRLDYVVGSVHSAFRLGKAAMTERLIRAIHHPRLTILGHATGRLLLRREGYEIDLEAVIDAAADRRVVLEINAHPNRLDLDWRSARRAAERGCLIAINPDAHSAAALEHVAYGVNVARKAGLEPRQILNCWSLPEVEAYLGERKQAG